MLERERERERERSEVVGKSEREIETVIVTRESEWSPYILMRCHQERVQLCSVILYHVIIP